MSQRGAGTGWSEWDVFVSLNIQTWAWICLMLRNRWRVRDSSHPGVPVSPTLLLFLSLITFSVLGWDTAAIAFLDSPGPLSHSKTQSDLPIFWFSAVTTMDGLKSDLPISPVPLPVAAIERSKVDLVWRFHLQELCTGGNQRQDRRDTSQAGSLLATINKNFGGVRSLWAAST